MVSVWYNKDIKDICLYLLAMIGITHVAGPQVDLSILKYCHSVSPSKEAPALCRLSLDSQQVYKTEEDNPDLLQEIFKFVFHNRLSVSVSVIGLL